MKSEGTARKLSEEAMQRLATCDTSEEARRTTEEAGVELTDDELDGVAGGYDF